MKGVPLLTPVTVFWSGSHANRVVHTGYTVCASTPLNSEAAMTATSTRLSMVTALVLGMFCIVPRCCDKIERSRKSVSLCNDSERDDARAQPNVKEYDAARAPRNSQTATQSEARSRLCLPITASFAARHAAAHTLLLLCRRPRGDVAVRRGQASTVSVSEVAALLSLFATGPMRSKGTSKTCLLCSLRNRK